MWPARAPRSAPPSRRRCSSSRSPVTRWAEERVRWRAATAGWRSRGTTGRDGARGPERSLPDGARRPALEELPVAARPYPPIDPEAGIPDLIRRLAVDSKRLVGDEVRLAKLEVRENVRTGVRGALWMALAFGAAVVALVALTVLVAAVLGRLLGNYWAGALITGALELLVAFFLVKRGLDRLKQPS